MRMRVPTHRRPRGLGLLLAAGGWRTAVPLVAGGQEVPACTLRLRLDPAERMTGHAIVRIPRSGVTPAAARGEATIGVAVEAVEPVAGFPGDAGLAGGPWLSREL